MNVHFEMISIYLSDIHFESFITLLYKNQNLYSTEKLFKQKSTGFELVI